MYSRLFVCVCFHFQICFCCFFDLLLVKLAVAITNESVGVEQNRFFFGIKLQGKVKSFAMFCFSITVLKHSSEVSLETRGGVDPSDRLKSFLILENRRRISIPSVGAR